MSTVKILDMTAPKDTAAATRSSRENVLAVLRGAGYSPTREGVERMRKRLEALEAERAAEIAGQ